MKKLLLAGYILTLMALLLWWRWPTRGAFGRHPLQAAAPQAQPLEGAPGDPASAASNAPLPAEKHP